MSRHSSGHSSKFNKYAEDEDHSNKRRRSKYDKIYDDKHRRQRYHPIEARDNSRDVAFQWEHNKSLLNRIFFRDQDPIPKGTPEHTDFWAFLKKYVSYQHDKTVRTENVRQYALESVKKMTAAQTGKSSIEDYASVSVQELMSRAPVDSEDRRRLSSDKIAEFRDILLLYMDFLEKQKLAKFKKLKKDQANLPIAQFRDEIMRTVKANQIVIVAGDTGCGKSTQMPRYLLEADYENIACTQPRRLACISLCKRVAFETQNEFSSLVGFQIRFDKSKTQHTKVLFLTEGLLLRQVAADPMLSMYNVLILDEVHERHLHGDFLLGVVNCLVRQRSDLKIILMSATINIDLFRNYFWGAPVIQVPGRLYPITIQYWPVSIEEQASRTQRINPSPYLRIMHMIDDKYPSDERGDLLVFLSGITEINTLVEAAQLYAEQTNKWIILPLHSTLSLAEQDKVFDIAPEGVRKCIVSTNIAETSITIDGIRFVVDSGKVKEMNFDPTCKMQRLQEFWISKASAEQRKGRAGRTGPGVSFRLFSEEEYASLEEYSTPEIKRVPLDSQILQMISLGLNDVRKFPFIEPPSSDSLEEALASLKGLGAINDEEELTPLGRMLSNLPVDITIGKILIMGCLFDKVGPVLSLSAAMSVQSPYTNRSFRDPDAIAARKSLESDHGDPFTLLNAYNEWLDMKADRRNNSKHWCKQRGLEEQRFYEITKLRRQFEDLLKDANLLEIGKESNGSNLSGAERAQRHGELKRLKEAKKEYHRAPKRRKLLKVGDEVDDTDDNGFDIRDIDFHIQNDKSQIKDLSYSSRDFTYRDLLFLKFILCSGLYPQFAVADKHNSYKPGSDQMFHTRVKPFVVVHPTGIFTSQPDVLELRDSDIITHPEFPRNLTISNRHQLIVYVSLLETTKPYLMNTFRVPAIQTLLLFAQNIDTNYDFSRIVFDSFLEVRFPEPACGQDMAMQAIGVRKLWNEILHAKLNQNECDEQLSLKKKLIYFLQEEPFYTLHRLLAADLKDLFVGPSLSTNDSHCVPGLENAILHPTKGGVRVTPFLTYNCLKDQSQQYQDYLQTKWICPLCEKDFMYTVLERMQHQAACREELMAKDAHTTTSLEVPSSSHLNEYYCEHCKQRFHMTSTDILKHNRIHRNETKSEQT
ncbi:hypothetical protein CHUAL_009042 [Chamberlinius hualienensis]